MPSIDAPPPRADSPARACPRDRTAGARARRRRLRAGVIAAAAPLVLGSCLLTGTKVFTYSLGDIHIQGSFFSAATAELAENAVYREHRGDIERVDEVGFITRIENRTIADANVSIRFSDDPNLTSPVDVRDRTFPLLSNLAVPAGGDRLITYRESIDGMQSFEQFRTMVEEGSVTIYAVSDGFFNLDLRDFTLVVTFTVGL